MEALPSLPLDGRFCREIFSNDKDIEYIDLPFPLPQRFDWPWGGGGQEEFLATILTRILVVGMNEWTHKVKMKRFESFA